MSTQTALRPGDVYSYRPAQQHCREGIAIVVDYGGTIGLKLTDTFWLSSVDHLTGKRLDWDAFTLTPEQIAEAEFTFSISGFRPAERGESVTVFDDADVLTISSQHGHVKNHFVREGASRSNAAILDRKREAVAKARIKADSARFGLDNEIRELQHLVRRAARGEQL